MRQDDILPNIIQWSDRYKVGVEYIDHAHQELFTIVQRLHKLVSEAGQDKWACEQAIKYLKNYTLKHFAEEEAYMASIGYPGLADQQMEHAKMRDQVLPRLEKHLVEQNYGREVVQRFLKVCYIWLDKHIRLKDKPIGLHRPS